MRTNATKSKSIRRQFFKKFANDKVIAGNRAAELGSGNKKQAVDNVGA